MDVATGTANSSGAPTARQQKPRRHAQPSPTIHPPRDRGSKTQEGLPRSIVAAALLAIAAVGSLGACASIDAVPGGSSSSATLDTTIVTQAGAASFDRSDPGSVAAAFTLSMTRGNYDVARALLNPNQARVLEALATSAKGVPGTTAIGTLAPGRERISGDTGTVALIGELCREGIAATGAPTPDCIKNTDPDTVSPLFTVHVVRIDGLWYATFPIPPATEITTTAP